MEDNRQEALNKAKKAQQMMLIQAEMEKQMQPTVPEVQAGYMHLNRFGSPLPIHGLGTPGRTTMAQDIQDGNLVMQHRMQVANRNPIGMSRVPFLGDPMDYAMVD